MIDKLSNIELLEKVWNSSIDGMVLSDKDGMVIKANNQYYNIYGYSESEIIGQNFAIIFPKEIRETANQHYQEVFKSDVMPPKFESEIQRKDGTKRIVLSRAEFLFHNNEKIAILSVITDITEQKIYEKQILEQNEILKLAFENERVAWWDWDYASGEVKFSPNKATMIGYSINEFPTNVYKICDLIHPDDYDQTMKIMLEHLQGSKQFYEVIYRIKTKSSSYVYYYDFGKIIEKTKEGKPKRIFGIVFNINQQKQVENELQKSKEKAEESEIKFKSYIENAPDGIIVFKNNGDILDANPEITNLFGYSKKELLSIKKPVFAVETDNDKIKKSVEKLLTEGRSIEEYQMQRKDKSTFYGIMSAVKISDNQTLAFIKNIDEIKQTQNELIQAKEKAEESDRLKSAFLKNISHEIRTPMNAICGFSDLLLKPNINIDKQKQFTEIVHKSINQLLNVVENTITISSIETNQLKLSKIEFNPNKLFSELFDDYKRLQPKIEKSHIEFKISINQEQNITINNDFTRIKQIISILLDNAFKFTNNGKIEFGYHLENNQINFYVSDTGIGIPQDKQEIIFKSFTQANDTIRQLFGGVGLGLSIAIGLIKIIGGKLTINSVENKGTKIEFCLPIEQTVNAINKIDNKEQKKLENINLLVAEDEDFNFQYIEELLSETKIKIIHAINGYKAVEICKNQNIDIILMDLKMPIMDGFEATNEIRKFNKKVPIIAQTAFSYKREDCINSGFTDYIAKPFSDEELIKMITQYADR